MNSREVLERMAKAGTEAMPGSMEGDWDILTESYRTHSRAFIQAALAELVEITGAVDEDGFLTPDVAEDLGYLIIKMVELKDGQ